MHSYYMLHVVDILAPTI